MSTRDELLQAAIEGVLATQRGKVIVSLPDGSRIEVRRLKGAIKLTKLGKRVYNLNGRGAEGGES